MRVMAALGLEADINALAADDKVGRKLQDLVLEAPIFPTPELGNFGIFLDSPPDRRGQTLMKRREALQGCRPRTTNNPSTSR